LHLERQHDFFLNGSGFRLCHSFIADKGFWLSDVGWESF